MRGWRKGHGYRCRRSRHGVDGTGTVTRRFLMTRYEVRPRTAAVRGGDLLEAARGHLNTRQARLFEQAPGFIIIMGGPAHIVEFVNDAHRSAFNSAHWIGKSIREAFPS